MPVGVLVRMAMRMVVAAVGRAVRVDNPVSRRRFLARQPSAEGYAGFADFGMWRLEVEDAHFIGGRLSFIGK
mgnify:CR=1 FL=1